MVPDEVILTLGVETWNKNMEIAKGQNDAIVARVFALADEYGIAPEHVQTDYVSIEPRYRNGYYDERDFIGYFVHKTLVITLRDLDKFEDLLADALEAGVNYVHGIQFRTTELRKHRDEARALAIRAAKEKAEALAGELGQEVGDPKTDPGGTEQLVVGLQLVVGIPLGEWDVPERDPGDGRRCPDRRWQPGARADQRHGAGFGDLSVDTSDQQQRWLTRDPLVYCRYRGSLTCHMASMMASAISWVPTAVGSSRLALRS